MSMVSLLRKLPDQLPLPELFTDPFNYVPCEVVRIASHELIRYIESQEQWREELSRGKMFGVLVCKTKEGDVGFLSAFSGNLDGQTQQPTFVPPIFDLHSIDSFFRAEESVISAINSQIKAIEEGDIYIDLSSKIEQRKALRASEVTAYKQLMKRSKADRDKIRSSSSCAAELQQITKESQFQKAELKRIEALHNSNITILEGEKEGLDNQISKLKHERQRLSQELQRKIFESYILRNHLGEQRSMVEIFAQYRSTLPPAGAGECAAPKLLHYAFVNELTPIAMGEFWWGDSPKGEVRHNGEFYTACKSKCEPILGYMLRGMQLDSTSSDYSITRDLNIVYQDEFLAVVDKPAGMLSVAGHVDLPSVEGLLPILFAQYADAKVVHRLDMDTSGLLLIALKPDIYRSLQRQFEKREVEKEYLALLDGVISTHVGEINLPISSDYEQRPRQKIDYVGGKEAFTTYKLISVDGNISRVSLTPHTGRTHQLRLHCAHHEGIGVPIVGDRLYGHPATRLMLQAQRISFIHPASASRMSFELEAEF